MTNEQKQEIIGLVVNIQTLSIAAGRAMENVDRGDVYSTNWRDHMLYRLGKAEQEFRDYLEKIDVK